MPSNSYIRKLDAATTAPLLEIRGLSKRFDGVLALNQLDLSIYPGEVFALLGPSGCGKSTLLRLLAGFESPSAGSILLDGEDLSQLPPHRRPINMMFQSYALFPHMTVEQNIAFGLKQDRMARPAIAAKVEEVLSLVQLSDYGRRRPHQLSGGQRQRVALARCLAKSPRLLLLDEPMAALDRKLRIHMQLEIVAILDQLKLTCVMVTHDQEEAMTMADRVGIMNNGVLGQVGSPVDVYEHPNSRMTAEFVGSVTIFDGVLRSSGGGVATIDSPALDAPLCVAQEISGTVGLNVSVAVRPEKILLSRHHPGQQVNLARGFMEDIAYLGSHSVYHVRLPSGKRVLASRTNQHAPAGGAERRLSWDEEVYLCWSEHCGVVLAS